MTDTQTTPKTAEPATNGHTENAKATVTPRVDIRENDHELILLVDMPGVAANDIDVRVEDGELHIHGKVGPAREGEALAREFVAGDFCRSFRLHEALATAEIDAELKNGVLTVRLPKPAKNQPRQVTVKAS